MVALRDHTRSRIRSNHEDRDQGQGVPTVEQLIRETHVVLEHAGVRLSPSKVTRTCRDYLNIVSNKKGVTFGEFLANVVSLDALERRVFDSVYYRLTHADPTGETATRNVDRELGGAHV